MQFTISPNARTLMLADLLAAWAPQADIRINAALGEASESLYELIVNSTPVGHGLNPGTLKRSWRLDRSMMQYVISNPTPHLQYVRKGNNYPNQGGGTGWIYPVNGPALAFSIDGMHFVRRRVKASKPNDFVKRAIVSWRPGATDLLRESVHSSARWIVTGA